MDNIKNTKKSVEHLLDVFKIILNNAAADKHFDGFKEGDEDHEFSCLIFKKIVNLVKKASSSLENFYHIVNRDSYPIIFQQAVQNLDNLVQQLREYNLFRITKEIEEVLFKNVEMKNNGTQGLEDLVRKALDSIKNTKKSVEDLLDLFKRIQNNAAANSQYHRCADGNQIKEGLCLIFKKIVKLVEKASSSLEDFNKQLQGLETIANRDKSPDNIFQQAVQDLDNLIQQLREYNLFKRKWNRGIYLNKHLQIENVLFLNAKNIDTLQNLEDLARKVMESLELFQ